MGQSFDMWSGLPQEKHTEDRLTVLADSQVATSSCSVVDQVMSGSEA